MLDIISFPRLLKSPVRRQLVAQGLRDLSRIEHVEQVMILTQKYKGTDATKGPGFKRISNIHPIGGKTCFPKMTITYHCTVSRSATRQFPIAFAQHCKTHKILSRNDRIAFPAAAEIHQSL